MLAAVSDLHWPESKADLAAMATQAQAAGAKAIIVAGDAVSQFHPERLRAVLSGLRSAAPQRIYLPGNHELWHKDAPAALLYEKHLPKIAEDEGWHYLDAAPAYVDDVAVVGNVGWYDYTLADRSTFPDFQLAFGQQMVLAARRKPCMTVRVADVTDEQLSYKAAVIIPPPLLQEAGLRPALLRWNDGRYVHLGVSDALFAEDCARRLDEHLRQAANRADRIVVATHTCAFAGALNKATNPVEALLRAYQGSLRLGEVIMDHRKVVLNVFGHRHRPGRHQVEHLPVINVTGRPDRGGHVWLGEV